MSFDWRYELKLVCDAHRLPQARSWVRLHPAGFVVAYPPRRVNSLYLDNLQLGSFEDNLAGSCTREKLRLRWYSDEMDVIQPTLELKQKKGLLGRKRQSALPCGLDMTRDWAEILKLIRSNAGPEWQLVLQTLNQPTLLNHYQREYYVTPDGAVRLTLDFALKAYDQRFSPRPNRSACLHGVDCVVIEIKTTPEHAERLPDVVAHFPIPRSRNSKYVRALMSSY
ncbi:MAG: polyphosphate polymerase domain-containing protein [Thermoflexales bacterium]|nr:polyphosphate polymerase domain-containing protein [Thermoflexales bacterium]